MSEKTISKKVEELLRVYSSQERAATNQRFFKTGKGEYGEGDIFLGVTVPDTRKVVKEIVGTATLSDAETLLHSPYHEVRLVGAHLFVTFYDRSVKEGKGEERAGAVESYLRNAQYFNNWDLVDVSAAQILGRELICNMDREERETIVDKLIKSNHLWENRIAVVSMHAAIKRLHYALPFSVIERLLFHPHDLMHKANGWMLREVGKYSGQEVLNTFLDKYAATMPRTTLRYALEHYDAKKRDRYMKMKGVI